MFVPAFSVKSHGKSDTSGLPFVHNHNKIIENNPQMAEMQVRT